MKLAIFDIDGTIADMSHREHLVKEDYPKFQSEVSKDSPIMGVIDILNALHREGASVVLVTGRTESIRDLTEKWLHEHKVSYDTLIMKQVKESATKSFEFKRRVVLDYLTEHDLSVKEVIAFDDKEDVVRMYSEIGIQSLQVTKIIK